MTKIYSRDSKVTVLKNIISLEEIQTFLDFMTVEDEYYDDRFSGIPNNAGSGVTGDIDFTTVANSNGDAYSIILLLNKN